LWEKQNRCNGGEAAALPGFSFRKKRKDLGANVARLATLHVSLHTHKSCSLYRSICTHRPQCEMFERNFTDLQSNKSTNQMHQSLRFIARRSNTVQIPKNR
jgi:hypothetical protein